MRICSGSPSNFSRMERKGSAKKSVEGSARCKPIIADESQSVSRLSGLWDQYCNGRTMNGKERWNEECPFEDW